MPDAKEKSGSGVPQQKLEEISIDSAQLNPIVPFVDDQKLHRCADVGRKKKRRKMLFLVPCESVP